jgi:hypothetical protein
MTINHLFGNIHTLNKISFNADNYQEFATTGKRRVIFWSWESNEKGFEFYSPAFQ